MNINKIGVMLNLVLVSVLFCLVTGQQPPPSPVPPVVPQNNTTNSTVCVPTSSKPSPQPTKYSFKTCIVAQFSAYLTVNHSQYIELTNGVVNQNISKCENGTIDPKLVIDFHCAQLSFSISHTNDSKTFVQAITGYYNLPNQTTFSNTSLPFKTSTSGHYYKCNSPQTVPLDPSQNQIALVISNFALEAYRNTNSTDFYQIVEECQLDSQPVSDWVRIGVGISLIALVAIVLVAYFVGRRRWSERSSYESV